MSRRLYNTEFGCKWTWAKHQELGRTCLFRISKPRAPPSIFGTIFKTKLSVLLVVTRPQMWLHIFFQHRLFLMKKKRQNNTQKGLNCTASKSPNSPFEPIETTHHKLSTNKYLHLKSDLCSFDPAHRFPKKCFFLAQ